MKHKTNKLAVGMLASLVTGMAVTEASAQSVEVYGLVGTYVGSMKRSGDAAPTRQLGGGGLTTSFIGFKGEENLGGGLKTVFALESFFRPDTGEQGRNATDPLFSRNAYIGVEGGFGRLTFGRQTNLTYVAMGQLSPFGNSVVFAPLTLQSFVATYGSNLLGDPVWNNVIQYATPTMNGFRGSVLYAPGEVAGRSGVANLGLHGTYTVGKLYSTVSFQCLRVNGTTPIPVEQNVWLAGANYDFGLVKLFGSAEHTSIDGGNATRLFDLGLAVPVSGTGTVMLEAATPRIEPAGTAAYRRTTTSLGYDHRLSKRTDVYAIYSDDKKSTASNAGSVALGIRHLF